MTVLGTLMRGEGAPVLQTCRFEGLGGQAYGREAISGLLAAIRPSMAGTDLDIESDRMGVWMDAEHAIVADLSRGLVQRIWVLGDQTKLAPLPALDVPVDPDLGQAGGSIRFEPCDHPDLHADHRKVLVDAVGSWPEREIGRFRPVILRAASLGGRVVALTRLEGEALGGLTIPSAYNGLAIVDETAALYRTDGAGRAADRRRTWSPRL